MKIIKHRLLFVLVSAIMLVPFLTDGIAFADAPYDEADFPVENEDPEGSYAFALIDGDIVKVTEGSVIGQAIKMENGWAGSSSSGIHIDAGSSPAHKNH